MSNRIPALFAMLAVACILDLPASGQKVRSDVVNAEGVVVGVQLEPGAARSPMDVNSESLGGFAEVWMVRVEHWLRPNGAKYILVEYTHVNRKEPFVKDSELNSTVWSFQFTPAPKSQRGTCISWGDRFVPTAFGRHEKLPTPKTLACFQMQKRPIFVGHESVVE